MLTAMVGYSLLGGPGHPPPGRTRGLIPTPAPSYSVLSVVAQSVFPSASDSMAELLSPAGVSNIASRFRTLIPERYEGDLVQKLEQALDSSLPVSATIPWLFSITAFLASNNLLTAGQIDTFLRRIIDQRHTESLARFMGILTPTVQVFANLVLESAIRIKNTDVLDTLLRRGVKLDSKLFKIASLVGDVGLTKRLLLEVDLASLAEGIDADLLDHFVENRHLDLAELVLKKGVSPDALLSSPASTALHRAAASGNIEGIKFLLRHGADVNLPCWYNGSFATPLGQAVHMRNSTAVALLLDHGADVAAAIQGTNLLASAALNSRTIYNLLRERIKPTPVEFLLGDLVDAANHGRRALGAYLLQHKEVTMHQMEEALENSILQSDVKATITLLQYGVSPDCLTLDTPPLVHALDDWNSEDLIFVGLLVGRNADLTRPQVLCKLVEREKSDLFELALASGVEPEHRLEALVTVAQCGRPEMATVLLRTGVDVNAPGLRTTPLQAASSNPSGTSMMKLLIGEGANVNTPAHPNGGRTPLQAALGGDNGREAAEILLSHGADASAPPALQNGVTALEALCHNPIYWDQKLCHKLLDAGATVNRPGGQPSSALHGVIDKEWYEILARFLEPQHHTIVNYIWKNEGDNNLYPYTPTQLASSMGDLKALTMLLDYGADVNEAPANTLGRTALQAAALRKPGPHKMAVINLLLERGANVGAGPANDGGVTALQAAAISGDITLADLFLSRGADVNEDSSEFDGRTALEGAAEHGRLDMVQLLLNAGAQGDFDFMMEVTEDNGHPAVAALLKEHEQECSISWVEEGEEEEGAGGRR